MMPVVPALMPLWLMLVMIRLKRRWHLQIHFCRHSTLVKEPRSRHFLLKKMQVVIVKRLRLSMPYHL